MTEDGGYWTGKYFDPGVGLAALVLGDVTGDK